MSRWAPKRRWEVRCVRGWDSWSNEEIRALQDDKLRRFITKKVYPFHPYYRRLFDENKIDPESIRTVKDLQRIPFTFKEDIAPQPQDPESPRAFVLEPGFDTAKPRRSDGWVPQVTCPDHFGNGEAEQAFREEYQPIITMFTTGRTAEPTPFFFTLHDMERMREAGRRLAAVISSRAPEDYDRHAVAINHFPGTQHLAYWVAVAGAEGTAVTTINSGVGPSLGNERILNIIERAKPNLFMGLPSYTYDLFKIAAEQGRDFSSIEIVAMGGDRMTGGSREKIAELLEQMGAVDPVVTGAFGATEMKYAWGDCGEDESQGYHTCPDFEIIEVVDPDTGEVLGEGETGELVVTNLDAHGSVVLRYRTGDILVGGYATGRCPGCGRTMPRISSTINRRQLGKEFALSKVKGNLVDLNTFSDILNNSVDVLEWVVELRKRNNDPDGIDEVWIYICPTSVGEVTGLADRIAASVRTSLEFKPDRVIVTSFEEVAEHLSASRGTKWTRIVDFRPE
ncbi:MAG TPA: AMP-binding protein [Candidatus Anoxymicrobiaceae bacterium]|jgi:phenylacetate-CoA ligase